MAKARDLNRDSEFVANDGVVLCYHKPYHNVPMVTAKVGIGAERPMQHPYYLNYWAAEVVEEGDWIIVKFQRKAK